MEKRIIATKATRELIRRAYNVSDAMVSLSLNYKKDNDLARRIRSLALQKGAHELSDLQFDTTFAPDGYMRQMFPNGILLEVNLHTGTASIKEGERVMETYAKPTITDLESIQLRANNYSVNRILVEP